MAREFRKSGYLVKDPECDTWLSSLIQDFPLPGSLFSFSGTISILLQYHHFHISLSCVFPVCFLSYHIRYPFHNQYFPTSSPPPLGRFLHHDIIHAFASSVSGSIIIAYDTGSVLPGPTPVPGFDFSLVDLLNAEMLVISSSNL